MLAHLIRAAVQLGVVGLSLCTWAETVAAKPSAPSVFCDAYPDAPDCDGKVVSCAYCHASTDPPAWNAYGESLKAALPAGADFTAALPDALAVIEVEDSDGDGVANGEELMRGSAPGEADADTAPTEPAGENPRYRLGQYDAPYALRRVMTLYCGRSPSYDELEALRRGDEAAQRAAVHEALAKCLQSDHWQKTALPRLADKRIKPLRAIGTEATIQIAGYRVVIGDYAFDYRLWRYVLSNDRDMRELLTADYFVVEGEDGSLVQTWDVIPRPDPKAFAGGQPIERAHRAGMITTQWFLTFNTMFSPLPRTTAAQAYRAYLGADIAANEGLIPVEGEPTDVDSKGVAQPRCATCHSTLDPLAYAFMRYDGIDIGAGGVRFGNYTAQRPTERIPTWNDDVQRPYLFGQPVRDLVEWARVAAESDAFARNMATVFFEHALGRAPETSDVAEFAALWKSCRDDGYSANKLIHRLVDTLSFGAP